MNNSNTSTRSPIENLLHWLIPIIVFTFATRVPVDPDMWWHLSDGKAMFDLSRILTVDVFSFTKAGASWTNAFWLADLGLFGAYRLGGFFALSVLAAGIITLTMLVLINRISAPLRLSAWVVLVGAIGLIPFEAVRPQLLSFLFLAILDSELSRYKNTGNLRPWFFILLFVFWANLHGGFILGILLLGAFVTGEILNRVIGAENPSTWQNIGKLSFYTTLAGLSTLINPNGFALWKLPSYTVQVSLQNISEWASPDFHRLDLQPMLWLIFLFILGLGFSKKTMDWGDFFKMCGFAFLAFVSQRNIAPFIVIAVPVVAEYLWLAWEGRLHGAIEVKILKRKPDPTSKISPNNALIINIILIAVLILAALTRAYWFSNPSLVYAELPTEAVRWLQDNKPAGRIFNSYTWGGFLIWALPEYPVFIDGRADLYGAELMNEWGDVIDGTDNGIALLNKWQINLIFIEPDRPIVKQLPGLGWRLLYKDAKSVIFGR